VEYVGRKEDPLTHVVRKHQLIADSTVLQTARYLKTEVQKERRKNEGQHSGETKERWQGKRMHGQLPHKLDEKLVDIERSYR